jgi:methylmalonyl-CoA mutase C-terminal domain/subunit
VVLAKPGMDGHNRGVRVVARALVDAGCEVVYLGIRRTPADIALTAVEEDADIVGLSLLSGAHIELCRAVRASLDGAGAQDVRLICGGIIPADDIPALHEIGVRAVFTPGASLQSIRDAVWTLAADRRSSSSRDQVDDVQRGVTP